MLVKKKTQWSFSRAMRIGLGAVALLVGIGVVSPAETTSVSANEPSTTVYVVSEEEFSVFAENWVPPSLLRPSYYPRR